MKYCVIKNTTKVIDGSENPLEIMLQNAQNAGITDFEILTEEEYEARKALEPEPLQSPTDKERIEATEAAILALMEVLG